MTTGIRAYVNVIAQTAAAWPSASTGWTRQALLDPDVASEGQGQALGDAQIEQVYGSAVKQPAGTSVATVVPVGDLIGKYVRLLKADGAGTITTDATGTIPGGPYIEFWWGEIVSAQPDLEGGVDQVKVWNCRGIAGILSSILLTYGREEPGPWTSPGNLINPGYLPKFNAIVGGDRSSGTHTINSVAVYTHNRFTTPGSGFFWTAQQVLKHLLAVVGQPYVGETGSTSGALQWVLAGLTGALDYKVETLDLHGKSLLDAINFLVNPRRGLTWKVSIAGAVATITVASTARSAISGGSYSLPAAATQTTLDLTASVFHDQMSLVTDGSAMADVIEVVGGFPRVGISISRCDAAGSRGHWANGWTTSQESFWAYGTQIDGYTDEVWHRFLIDSAWEGGQWVISGAASSGMRNEMAVSGAGDASYGDGGYTGVRSYSAGGTPHTPPALALVATRTLPFPSGTTLGSAPVMDPAKAELMPLIFVSTGGRAAAGWLDKTSQFSIRIEENPPAVVIGASLEEAYQLQDLIANNEEIIITLGMRESWPLRVSWIRATSDWPRDAPRMLTIREPTAEQWVILAGTVSDVSTNVLNLGELETDIQQVVRDDTDRLRQILALARAYHASAAVALSWRDQGVIDIGSALAPTALITDVTTFDGTVAANSTITRRGWNFRELDQSTSYTTERLIPDLDAIL